MNLFDHVPQMIKMLRNLDKWLETAAEYAKMKSFDPDILLQARLAPDQYPLMNQIQASCDSAKFAVAHLSGQKAPVHPDTEKTFAEARARIASCIGYLETAKESDFASAAQQKVSPAWMAGKWVAGDKYLLEMALPNFYFHITTAYAILRHNGVGIGKMAFIGSLPFNDPEAA